MSRNPKFSSSRLRQLRSKVRNVDPYGAMLDAAVASLRKLYAADCAGAEAGAGLMATVGKQVSALVWHEGDGTGPGNVAEKLRERLEGKPKDLPLLEVLDAVLDGVVCGPLPDEHGGMMCCFALAVHPKRLPLDHYPDDEVESLERPVAAEAALAQHLGLEPGRVRFFDVPLMADARYTVDEIASAALLTMASAKENVAPPVPAEVYPLNPKGDPDQWDEELRIFLLGINVPQVGADFEIAKLATQVAEWVESSPDITLPYRLNSEPHAYLGELFDADSPFFSLGINAYGAERHELLEVIKDLGEKQNIPPDRLSVIFAPVYLPTDEEAAEFVEMSLERSDGVRLTLVDKTTQQSVGHCAFDFAMEPEYMFKILCRDLVQEGVEFSILDHAYPATFCEDCGEPTFLGLPGENDEDGPAAAPVHKHPLH